MDKLIKSIPDDHMGLLAVKAAAEGVSTSAYVRELIRKDVGVTDLIIKDVSPDKARKLQINAAGQGLTIEQYVFLNL